MVWTSRKSMIFRPLLDPVSASEQRFIINHFFSVGWHTFLEENSKNVFFEHTGSQFKPIYCTSLCMLVFTHSYVWGRGRQRGRKQRFEAQGWDTCGRAPPRYSSSPSRPSKILQRQGARRWRVRRKGGKRQGAKRRMWWWWEGKGGGEKKHFRGILLDRYNSTAISMVNSLCCIQFALFPRTTNSQRSFCLIEHSAVHGGK